MPRAELKSHQTVWTRFEGLPVIMAFAAVIGAFMITAPESFLGYRMYTTLASTVVPPLILGLGLTLVIAAGEIDLSFPSVLKVSGLTFVMIAKFGVFPLDEDMADKHDLLVLGAFAAAILVGGLIGFVNGLLVVRIGIPSIIATLATLFVWEGATVVSSGGLSHNIRAIKDYVIYDVLTGRIGAVPVQFFWAIALAVLMWFVLNRHRFGEHLLFIGDNANVARVVGVKVDRERIKLFTLMGVLGALSGVILTLENRNFFTTQGTGFLLVALAAVFIGGTSISGGRGSIVGTVFGCFIVGTVEAGVVGSGISGFWTRLVVGLVFLAAVTFHLAVEKPMGLAGIRRIAGMGGPGAAERPKPPGNARPP